MNPTLIVMRKELKEMLRDKRVRSSAFIMPMLLIILMLVLFGFISGIGEKENQRVHIVKTDNAVIKAMRLAKFQVVVVDSVEEGQKLIREGKARVVLDFPADFDAKVQAGQPAKIAAYYDPQQETAHIALSQTSALLEKVNEAARDKALAAHHMTKDSIEPVQIEEKKIQVGKTDTNEFLVSMLPYFIVIWAFYGGIGTAGDLVAGEKEKYTLETLLIAPVGRSQIALGKFLALATICLVSSLSAVMGVVVAGLSGLPLFAKLFPHGLGLGATEFGTIILVLIPTVAFFASLLIAISTYAKNPREAQSYLALVSLVVIMPAIFGQVIGFTDLAGNWWIRLIPVLNTSVTVREALQGKTSAMGLILTIAVGAVLALIGILIAVRLFKREQVLTRI